MNYTPFANKILCLSKWLIADRRLDAYQHQQAIKSVSSVLSTFAQWAHHGETYVSQHTIASRSGRSRKTIQKWLPVIVASGILPVVRKGGYEDGATVFDLRKIKRLSSSRSRRHDTEARGVNQDPKTTKTKRTTKTTGVSSTYVSNSRTTCRKIPKRSTLPTATVVLSTHSGIETQQRGNQKVMIGGDPKPLDLDWWDGTQKGIVNFITIFEDRRRAARATRMKREQLGLALLDQLKAQVKETGSAPILPGFDIEKLSFEQIDRLQPQLRTYSMPQPPRDHRPLCPKCKGLMRLAVRRNIMELAIVFWRCGSTGCKGNRPIEKSAGASWHTKSEKQEKMTCNKQDERLYVYNLQSDVRDCKVVLNGVLDKRYGPRRRGRQTPQDNERYEVWLTLLAILEGVLDGHGYRRNLYWFDEYDEDRTRSAFVALSVKAKAGYVVKVFREQYAPRFKDAMRARMKYRRCLNL